MKFGFKLGKSKEKEAPEEAIVEEETGAEQVDELLQSVEATAVKPHAPLQELSLEGDEETAIEEAILPEEGEGENGGETVKLVEVKAAPTAAVPPPPPPAPVSPAVKKDAGGKPADPLDISASINSIFTEVEDEENPLANLIKTLPEVAATELMDDINEINDIIKDWKKH
jgi:hypothetical protein